MEYVFSDKVSGLQASAIREILKFCAFPDIISLGFVFQAQYFAFYMIRIVVIILTFYQKLLYL